MSSPVISCNNLNDRDGICDPVYFDGVGSTGRSDGGRRRICCSDNFDFCCAYSGLFTTGANGGVGGGVHNSTEPLFTGGSDC